MAVARPIPELAPVISTVRGVSAVVCWHPKKLAMPGVQKMMGNTKVCLEPIRTTIIPFGFELIETISLQDPQFRDIPKSHKKNPQNQLKQKYSTA